MRFVSARHPGVGAHCCVTSLPPTHPCRQPCLPCPLERPQAATGDSIRPKSGRLCSESWAEERCSRHCGALPCCMPPAKRFHLAQQQQPPTHQNSGPSFCMLYHALDISDTASSACMSMRQTRPADAATCWLQASSPEVTELFTNAAMTLTFFATDGEANNAARAQCSQAAVQQGSSLRLITQRISLAWLAGCRGGPVCSLLSPCLPPPSPALQIPPLP